ncbi:MAG TPA: hypothetical protein VHE37_15935 [Nevskiaceae bacterium]|nr:hypothetical protein [Nevskiaceae bacterium]
MRIVRLAALAGLLLLAGCADEPRAPYGTPALRKQLLEQFKAADKDGNDNLTRDEAAAGMPSVAAHFDEIDTDHNERVNFAEIWNYAQWRGIADRRRSDDRAP